MNETGSSCDISPGPTGGAPGSRVHRFRDFRWDGVSVAEYKKAADNWCGIIRMTLAGDRGEKTAFQVRYFEMGPGGFSSGERHTHEHVVVVLRGRGQVLLGDATHEVGFGDVIYVAPHDAHQLRNPSDTEPFGFLCVVDAERDVPTPVKESTAARM